MDGPKIFPHIIQAHVRMVAELARPRPESVTSHIEGPGGALDNSYYTLELIFHIDYIMQ